MSCLVANCPPVRAWIRAEYLYDLRRGHGDFVECYWVSIKSLPGQAFRIEAYIPSRGALYDKLPISAFLIWDPDSPDDPVLPDPDLPLESLQWWNCFDTGIVVIEKNLIYNMSYEVFPRNSEPIMGSYLFTVDSYHPDRSLVDLSFAEDPAEHKSQNFIVLDNGQIAIVPNNRMRLYDPSLTPEQVVDVDFKVCAHYYQVESDTRFGRLGSEDDY